MNEPIICFGQHPCGFFPKRFLYSKIKTALRLQSEIGGKIIFFCHDSDHDLRETQTLLTNLKDGKQKTFNFTSENQIQKKWSPLYLKRIPHDWASQTARQLPAYVDKDLVTAFKQCKTQDVASFCLEMYEAMGLLKHITVMRSSDPAFRKEACEISDYFIDTPYQGEVVRARKHGDRLQLHEGGSRYIDLDPVISNKAMISPTRDTRLVWMQSVIHCTHYIAGMGEIAYLNTHQAPEITFVSRDPIDKSNEAYTQIES